MLKYDVWKYELWFCGKCNLLGVGKICDKVNLSHCYVLLYSGLQPLNNIFNVKKVDYKVSGEIVHCRLELIDVYNILSKCQWLQNSLSFLD